MADLTISINGDCKKYEDALEQASSKTEALNGKLQDLSVVAGAAFAVLTAEIFQSVKAFGESQMASNKLTQSLQNAGIYSDELMESYKGQAAELQKLTGVDDDAIIKSQALLQGMVGNQVISKDLTKSILDLSAAKGMDLQATTELIGKGIEGHVMGLNKLGITIDSHLDKEERTAKIIELVTQKFGGQAEAMNQGLGGIKGLTSAFGDFQENIGQRFAPFIEAAIQKMTKFFSYMNEHQAVADLAFALIAAGVAVSGLALAVGLGGMAWLQYTAMMAAAGLGTEALTLATRLLVGATGIGLLVILVAEIYMNWSTLWPKMQGIYQAFVENISQVSAGVGKILQGVFHLDTEKIKEGLSEAKEAVVKGYTDIAKSTEAIAIKPPGMAQDESKAELAAVQNEKEIEAERLKNAILDGERDIQLAKLNDASQAVIKLKTEELDTLKAMAEEKNAELMEDLTNHLEEIRAAKESADIQSASKNEEFNSQILANNKAYNAMSAADQRLFVQQNKTALTQSLETEKTIKNAYALKQVQDDVQRRNKFLLDEQEFGTAYAMINSMMHSKIAQGSKQAFGEMAQMQTSQNATLKEIGKIAAVANIVIKTAESAMNIYAGFAAIPIVGPALGIAGAAAAVAFGAEQVSGVMGAAHGGLMEGGIPNVDSIPVMVQQGELIVPRNSYEEVISAVSNQRNGGSQDSEGGSSRSVSVTVGFDSRSASQLLTIMQIEDTALGISPRAA